MTFIIANPECVPRKYSKSNGNVTEFMFNLGEMKRVLLLQIDVIFSKNKEINYSIRYMV